MIKDGRNCLKALHSTSFTDAFSKMGVIYFTKFLNKYFTGNKISVKVAAVHPGVIFTELYGAKLKCIYYIFYPFGYLLFKSVWRGAQTSLHLCYLNDSEFVSGGYYADNQQQICTKWRNDARSCKALWTYYTNKRVSV